MREIFLTNTELIELETLKKLLNWSREKYTAVKTLAYRLPEEEKAELKEKHRQSIRNELSHFPETSEINDVGDVYRLAHQGNDAGTLVLLEIIASAEVAGLLNDAEINKILRARFRFSELA